MSRKQNSGIVWRPTEYVLLVVLALLVLILVWSVRETDRLEVGRSSTDVVQSENDSDISTLIENGLQAEQSVDNTYDAWEEQSASVVESAADDIGGVYDESSF